MDARGARHLLARLATGGGVGQRVEVVSVENSGTPVSAGDTGTVVALGEETVRILLDSSGVQVAADPQTVTLRGLAPSPSAAPGLWDEPGLIG